MGADGGDGAAEYGTNRLLTTLEQLLAIQATELVSALNQATDLLSEALGADKIDAFLYDPAVNSLVAIGTSDTPMGRQQHALGLNRLPLVNGGRAVEVFQTGTYYLTGRADQDPGELPGLKHGLGIRSTIGVPLDVTGERRGVLLAASAQPDFFHERDLHFTQVVARWVGIVAQRAELVEQIAQDAAMRGRHSAAEELITVLAHDLGNYLTPLKVRIDMIGRRARREDRGRDCADAMAAAAALDRLHALVQGLLDVARLDQGLFSVEPQLVDLARLAHETAEPFATGTTDIQVHAPPELIVYADPNRIRQAVENLLANAIKHSPENRPVKVTVRTEAQADAVYATIAVIDQGPGVLSELLPHLFRRFVAGPGSAGLGLGLYLAHGIALAHCGRLTVHSTPGEGATFVLSVPIHGYGEDE